LINFIITKILGLLKAEFTPTINAKVFSYLEEKLPVKLEVLLERSKFLDETAVKKLIDESIEAFKVSSADTIISSSDFSDAVAEVTDGMINDEIDYRVDNLKSEFVTSDDLLNTVLDAVGSEMDDRYGDSSQLQEDIQSSLEESLGKELGIAVSALPKEMLNQILGLEAKLDNIISRLDNLERANLTNSPLTNTTKVFKS
jgi:molybdopterin converting factor small subunit